MHWDFALILLFLGIAVPLLGRRRVRQLMQMPSTTKIDRLSLYASTLAFQWIAAGVILWRTSAHEIRASQLGLAIPNPALAVTASVVLAALILLNQIMGLRRLVAQPEKIQGILPQLALKLFPQDDVERLAFFALVATVALCEELVYRGFVQRVFQNWSRGSVIIAVVGSAVFFALAHLYQGVAAWFRPSSSVFYFRPYGLGRVAYCRVSWHISWLILPWECWHQADCALLWQARNHKLLKIQLIQ